MKKIKITLFSVGVVFAVLIFISAYSYFLLTSKANIKNKDIKVQIKYGSSLSDIVHTLNEVDLLKPNFFFEKVIKFYAYTTGKTILAGYHKFPEGITNSELIVSLFTGNNLYMQKVTFPEGITIKRFASILQKQMGIDSVLFYNLCNDSCFTSKYTSKYNIKVNSLEGYLMPATFNFFLDIEIEKIIDILVEEQIKVLEKNKNAADKIGLTMHEVLTLASIIEAETPVQQERPIVSSVYHNRLRKNMLLQADPTVQYAISSPKKRLLYSDLNINSRYNTYKYIGLPPGPINSPSKSSIEAAVSPAKTKYLFFVATGDGSNTHNFSETYVEHQKKVKEFRNNLKKYKNNKK